MSGVVVGPASDLGRVVDEAARTRKGEFVEVLRSLLAVPSVNPSYDQGDGERHAQEQLAGVFTHWGLSPELWEPAPTDLHQFAKNESAAVRSFSGRPNLTVRREGGGGGRTLLLNSHVDVVPAGDGWRADPFRPRVADGKIVARGAADAKGSVAAMSCAFALVAELGVELDGTVTFESVVDEEAGGGGTLGSIGRGASADAAIVGEPTELALCPATRGSRRFRVDVTGRSAHPGEAFLGINAAEKAMLLVAAVRERARDLDERRQHSLWSHLPEQHVFNLNWFQAGSRGYGAVPDACTFEMAAGGTAAETIEELQAEVEAAVAGASAQDEWLAEHPPILEWDELVLHPSAMSVDHSFLNTCTRAFADATGDTPTVGALSAVTDMRHLVRYAGIPTLNFGPGRMRDAHGPEESVEIADFLTAISVLARIIVSWCGA